MHPQSAYLAAEAMQLADSLDLQQWTFPEEDRALYTTAPWRPGEFRWFKSPNVVCLEQWRRRQAHRGNLSRPPTSGEQ